MITPKGGRLDGGFFQAILHRWNIRCSFFLLLFLSVSSRSPPYLIAKKLLLATSKLPSIASMKNIQCRRFDNLSRFVLRKAGLCLYTSPASNAKYLILFVLSQQILLTADNSLHQKFLSVCFRQNLRPARTHCQFLHVLPVY